MATAPSAFPTQDVYSGILQDAMLETQRCFAVAEETRRHLSELLTPGQEHVACWRETDDDEQAEALQAITQLGKRGALSLEIRAHLQALEAELRVERIRRAEAESLLAQEQICSANLERRIHSLQHTLDTKESLLQRSRKALRECDVASLQARIASPVGTVGEFVMLEASLADRERQLEAKHYHIARLAAALRQSQLATFGGDCGSKRTDAARAKSHKILQAFANDCVQSGI